jgi:hypothetical protein
MVLDHAILPIVGALLDKTPGVGREEAIVVADVEPLGISVGVIRRQPNGDVFSRLIRITPGLWLNRINRRIMPTSCNFFQKPIFKEL